MNKLLFSLILLIAVGFSSCETDIDLNAEYKDIPVVYGLINPSDTNHYIKITKAFIGDASAIDLAANADNFNYADGELTVEVMEYDFNGVYVKSYLLTRTVNEIPKEPGTFDNSSNVLYKFVEPNINKNSTYQLKIYNSSLDKEITSETKIVDNSTVSAPTTQQKMTFWIGDPVVGANADRIISVTPGNNIGRLDVTFVFNYTEYYTTSSGLTPVVKSVRMPLTEKITTGNNPVEWELKGSTFFDNITNNVSNPTSIPFFSHRELDNITLEFNVAGTELSTYMLVSEPSNTVNQDKPSYTNIGNGLGVFSSRTKINWVSSVNPATGNINLNTETIMKLQSLGLGFCFGNSATSGHKCNQLP